MYTALLRSLISHCDFIHMVPTSPSPICPMSARPRCQQISPLRVNQHNGASRGDLHPRLLLLYLPRRLCALPYPRHPAVPGRCSFIVWSDCCTREKWNKTAAGHNPIQSNPIQSSPGAKDKRRPSSDAFPQFSLQHSSIKCTLR